MDAEGVRGNGKREAARDMGGRGAGLGRYRLLQLIGHWLLSGRGLWLAAVACGL